MPVDQQVAYRSALSKAMNAALLHTPDTDGVTEQLDRAVLANRQRPPGAMQMVALTAPFSAGKSTLIKQWGFRVHRAALGDRARHERPTWTPEPGLTADWRPVVYVTLMASSSIKEVNAQILMYLGYPPEGLARTTTTRVLLALRMHGVRVVILDDAHMLRSSSAQNRAVLDYIKFLNTELGDTSNGTVVLVGANLHTTALLDDPQIRARLTTLTIGPLPIDTIEQRSAWQRLLTEAETRQLPYLPAAPPGLFSRIHAQHVWRLTQGFVGEVAKLLTSAILSAFEDHRSEITRDHLTAVPLSDRSIDGRTATQHRPARHGR